MRERRWFSLRGSFMFRFQAKSSRVLTIGPGNVNNNYSIYGVTTVL